MGIMALDPSASSSALAGVSCHRRCPKERSSSASILWLTVCYFELLFVSSLISCESIFNGLQDRLSDSGFAAVTCIVEIHNLT